MKEWEQTYRTCMRFYKDHEKQIKIAVTILAVVTALLLFGAKGENQEIAVEQNGESNILLEEESGDAEDTSDDMKIVVDISGCVKTPGVYEIDNGTRLHQVIALAGGLTKDADIDAINQAEIVSDGQKILIPEVLIEDGEITNGISNTQGGKININQADHSQLQELPGVGPSTADKIIEYRQNHGRFQSIDDLKNVSGIGEKTFEKMKDKICV